MDYKERKKEAEKIAKIVTGTYDWQGVMATYGTSGLKRLINNAIGRNPRIKGTGMIVSELKHKNGISSYYPGYK